MPRTCSALRSSQVLWSALDVAPGTLDSAESMSAWLAAHSGRVSLLRLDLRPRIPGLARHAALRCAACPAVAPWLQSLELCDWSRPLSTGRALARLTALQRLSLAANTLIWMSADMAGVASLRELRIAWVRGAAQHEARNGSDPWELRGHVRVMDVPGCYPPGLTALTLCRISGTVPELGARANSLQHVHRLELLPGPGLAAVPPVEFELLASMTALTHLHVTQPVIHPRFLEPRGGLILAALSSLRVLKLTNEDPDPAQLLCEPSQLEHLQHLTALLMHGGWRPPPAVLLPRLSTLWFHDHSLAPGGLERGGLGNASRLTRLALPLATFLCHVPALRAWAGRASGLEHLLLFGGAFQTTTHGHAVWMAELLGRALRALLPLLPELKALEEICIDQCPEAEAALDNCR